MLKYLINPTIGLTTDYIIKAVQDFQTRQLPTLNKMWNYYVGKQKITKKQPTDSGKPNNISMVNYCNNITNIYNGYLTGLPITYSNDDFQDIIDVLNYNDTTTEDTQYLRNALIYGRAFECNYIDEEGKQRFRLFNTKECLPVYSNSLNSELLYVIRFYKEDLLENSLETYIVEVYGPTDVKKYRASQGFTSLTLIDEYPHFFNQCPVTVFSLNEDEESIFNQIITLQDSYNTLMSRGVDDVEAWADAYFVLKGVTADTEDIDAMKQHRVLEIDNDADAYYVTKDSNAVQLQYLLDKIDEQIYTISSTPNFADEKFMAQSGEALKYKLVGFETKAAAIENNMKKALQRRVELITSILTLTDTDEVWRDVSIKFTRNLPSNLTPITVTDLISYKGLVSDKTLLSLVPFIKNPDDELKLLEEQEQREIDSYEFGHTEDTE